MSIDLKTTGLDPERDQVLHAALVVEDTEQAPLVEVEDLPCFECLVWYPRYEGGAFAFGLNAEVMRALGGFNDRSFASGEIAARSELHGRELPVYVGAGRRDQPALLGTWETRAELWLTEQLGYGKVTAAGKNAAGFDLRFLRGPLRSKFLHRVLDPGSALVDFSADQLPSLDELKQKYDVGGPVTHDALEDARDVVRVLRGIYL